MGVDYIGSCTAGNLLNSLLRTGHEPQFPCNRDGRKQRTAQWCPIKVPAVDILFCGLGAMMLRRREMQGLPSEGPLLAQDCQRPEAVSALQWDGVIEHVQDPHIEVYIRLRELKRPVAAGENARHRAGSLAGVR